MRLFLFPISKYYKTMPNKSGQHFRLVFIFTFLLSLLISFQNCSDRPFVQESESGSKKIQNNTNQNEAGNGGSYDGKLYSHFGDCNEVPHSSIDQIVITSTNKIYQKRLNCEKLSVPIEIEDSKIKFISKSQFVYEGNEYVEEVAYANSLEFNFSDPGTKTWKKPGIGSSGIFECWGAGGGGGVGGGAGSFGIGGGGGGYSMIKVPLDQIDSSIQVTIGAGGTEGNSGYPYGRDGGESKIGSFLLAEGGKGGAQARAICLQLPTLGQGGTGNKANGTDGSIGQGGKGGGLEGGMGGLNSTSGASMGGGGGGGVGAGGGGVCGSNGPAAGAGGNGFCRIKISGE